MKRLEGINNDISLMGAAGSLLSYSARATLAWWIGEAGDTSEATKRFASLAGEYAEKSGTSDRLVKDMRNRESYWTASGMPPSEAKDHFRALIDHLESVPGLPPDILEASKRQLARLSAL